MRNGVLDAETVNTDNEGKKAVVKLGEKKATVTWNRERQGEKECEDVEQDRVILVVSEVDGLDWKRERS